MADNLYTTDPVSMSGGAGGSGAAAFYGVRQELLRRQAIKDEQERLAFEQEQIRLAQERQARQDALNAANIKSEMAAREENAASNRELRAAAAQQREEASNKVWLETFASAHKPGAPLTAEDKTELKKHGFGVLAVATPTMRTVETTPAIPATQLRPGDVGPSAPAQPAVTEEVPTGEFTDQFAGLSAQQDTERKRSFLQKIADTTDDPAIKVWALGELGGVNIPAGIARPKPTAQETKAAHDLAMQSLMSKIEQGYKPSETETADLKTWRAFNPTTAEQQKNALTRLNVTVTAAGQRQEDTQLDRAKSAAFARGNKDYDDLRFTLSRAGNLTEALAAGGGVGDAVAAPDFLSMMAAGFGTGMRMTDTELNRINLSQNKFSTLRSKISDYTHQRPFKLDETQRADMLRLAQYIAKRELARVNIIREGLDRINSATTADEVRRYENELDKAQLDILGSNVLKGEKEKTAVSAVPPSSKVRRFNPATGKVE